MAETNSRCVFVAEDEAHAGMIAALLSTEGFDAEVMNQAKLGLFEEMTGSAPSVSQQRLEVWVKNSEDVEPAKKWIAEDLKAAIEARLRKSERTGNVTAECEDCGKPSDWPAAEMGTTQVCPHCESYMDVPDPDENWEGVDFGEAEETHNEEPE